MDYVLEKNPYRCWASRVYLITFIMILVAAYIFMFINHKIGVILLVIFIIYGFVGLMVSIYTENKLLFDWEDMC